MSNWLLTISLNQCKNSLSILMVEIRHLSNAPITEAVIDFRVKNTNSELLQKSLNMLKEKLGSQYPKVQEPRGIQAEFQFREGELTIPSAKDTGFHGYFFISQDGLNIVQFRLDGFTFNRLKPYTSWEKIYPEALSVWKLYIQVAKPEYVIRVALRYINHLQIPLPIKDFSQYLTAPPNIPNIPLSTNYNLRGFLTRLLLYESQLNLEATITQTLEPSIESSVAIIILDIDAFKTAEFNPEDADIHKTLNVLREMKNKLFFGSITEETVRLLNGS